MSPLRTQRARAALAVSALVLALGSLALASPSSRPSLSTVSEPAPRAPRSRAWGSAHPPSGPRAGDGDGGIAHSTFAPPERAEDEPGTIIAQIIARFCVPYVATYCAARADCGCPGPMTAPERCEPETNELCADWARRTWRGAERLDATAIDEFLAGNTDRASACSSLWLESAPFATALARDGERCPAGAQYCADGLCESGTCHAYAERGAPCWPRGCAPGFVCGGDDTCVAIVGAGARCEGEAECEWPLACRGGRCRPPGDEGSPCDGDWSCEVGMRCGERDRCVVVDACDGRTSDCGRDRVCVGVHESRCVEAEPGWPVPELGHRCEWSCAVGSRCVEGRCVRGLRAGELCGGVDACGPGLACSSRETGWFCAPAAEIGEPCTRHGRDLPGCALDAFCDPETSVCTARPALGALCRSGTCGLGLECVDVIVDGACVPSICED